MTHATAVPPRQPSPTLTIDTESDPGSWATAIAHTPHLAAQAREAGEEVATPTHTSSETSA